MSFNMKAGFLLYPKLLSFFFGQKKTKQTPLPTPGSGQLPRRAKHRGLHPGAQLIIIACLALNMNLHQVGGLLWVLR